MIPSRPYSVRTLSIVIACAAVVLAGSGVAAAAEPSVADMRAAYQRHVADVTGTTAGRMDRFAVAKQSCEPVERGTYQCQFHRRFSIALERDGRQIVDDDHSGVFYRDGDGWRYSETLASRGPSPDEMADAYRRHLGKGSRGAHGGSKVIALTLAPAACTEFPAAFPSGRAHVCRLDLDFVARSARIGMTSYRGPAVAIFYRTGKVWHLADWHRVR